MSKQGGAPGDARWLGRFAAFALVAALAVACGGGNATTSNVDANELIDGPPPDAMPCITGSIVCDDDTDRYVDCSSTGSGTRDGLPT